MTPELLVEDGWKIVHEHGSVPLKPSGTAED
jgi:hypothetical protein